jgi:hypothetical protein
MHPMIDEMCRARGPQDVRPDVFRRWQQILKDEIAPQLVELEQMKAAATPLAVPSRRRGGEQ